MKRSYSFQVADGQQVVPITGSQNVASRFALVMDPALSAGTAKLEHRQIDSSL